ncbi:MerR family transcriptional regulator [Pendulispora rubella]|uniref:MerR family transcriptional regulator n=1 Tax=Pendulispora rubella TaxID=2741070 RepID=A0ABZ2L838_9BACT
MTDPNPTTEPPAYTIDELAALTRVPSRTIRFYQSRGALMAPEIRGRVAYYGAAHIERLKLIAQLQDRGLRVDAIRDFVKTIERGELDLAEWLGIERQMQAPWAHDQPRTVTESELYELTGSQRAGLIADLIRVGIVERRGDVYLVASPALLSVAMRLEAVGIDLDTAGGASAILRKHLGRAVTDLVDYFVSRAKDGHVDASNPEQLFEVFRVTGIESVRLLFGREMEQALRKLLASGKITTLSVRAKKRKKG